MGACMGRAGMGRYEGEDGVGEDGIIDGSEGG